MEDREFKEIVQFINTDSFGGQTTVTRQYDDDLTIWEMAEAFAQFLRGCGYAETNIREVLNIED